MQKFIKGAALIGFTIVLAACAREPEPEVVFEPAPVTVDPVTEKF